MSACGYCGSPISEAPARTCTGCDDRLHNACWDQIATRKILGCGHTANVVGCAYVRADTAVSLDSLGVLRAWNLSLGVDRTIAHLDNGGTGLQLSGDRKRFVAFEYNRASVFRSDDLSLERAVDIGDGISYQSYCDDGSRIAVTTNTRIRLIDVNDGSVSDVGEAFAATISKIAMSPDGTRIAILIGQSEFKIVDADTGEIMCERDLSNQAAYINSMQFGARGDEIFVDGENNLFALDGMTGQLRWKESLGNYPVALRHHEDGTIGFLSGGSYGDVQLYKVDRKANPVVSAPAVFRGLYAGITRASFLEMQHLMVATDEGILMLIDHSANKTTLFNGHSNSHWVNADQESRKLWLRENDIQSPDSGYVRGNHFVGPGPTPTGYGVRTISMESGEIVDDRTGGEVPANMRSIRHEGKDRVVLCVSNAIALSEQAAEIRWRTETGKYSDAASVVIARDGDGRNILLISAGYSALVQAFDLETGALRWTIERTDTSAVSLNNLYLGSDGAARWLIRRPNAPTTIIDVVRIAHDGTTSLDGALECSLSFGTDAAVFTPDRKHLVMGSVYVPPKSLAAVGMWDLESKSYVGLVSGDHRNAMRHVAMSPVGNVIATASNNRLVRIWSLPTGKRIATLGVLPRAINRLMFNGDGTILLGCADEGLAQAWDLSGLDRRTDAFAAFSRAKSGKSQDIAAAKTFLSVMREHNDPEIAAGWMVYCAIHRGASPDEFTAEKLSERVEYTKLRTDFDSRVSGEALTQFGSDPTQL